MPTNQEISAWLAQRGVQATPQNANIAARIMGAEPIASRGGTDQGAALDASGEINRLYDQLNTRSMGNGGTRRPAAPRPPPGPNMDNPSVGTPLPNPGAAAGGANPTNPRDIIPSPNALGVSVDELQGDPAAIAGLAALTGLSVAAVRAYLRRGGGAPPAAGGGGLPAVPGGGGGPAVPSGGGGTPPASGATPLVGRPVPGAPPAAVPALPTPAPQLPPPAAALPPPAAALPPPSAAPLPATSPTPVPGPLPPAPRGAAPQARVTPEPIPVGPGRPPPVLDAITARRLSPEAAREQQAQTPPGVVRGAGRPRGRGGFIPGGRHSPINPNTRVM